MFIESPEHFALAVDSWSNHIRSSTKQKIPKIFIFTHKTNLFEERPTAKNYKYAKNVLKTIRTYVNSWKAKGETNFFLWFMDDIECVKAIKFVKPELLPYFRRETRGDHKGDICRGAALHLTGGYYFDVDMRAILPVELPENVTFSAAASDLGHFNAYMVVTPKHPIIRDYLDILLHYYRRNHSLMSYESMEPFFQRIPTAHEAIESTNLLGMAGVWALDGALNYHKSWNSTLPYHYLHETNFESQEDRDREYPNFEFQTDGEGCCCNFLVQDREAKRPHFFSRFVGAKFTCEQREESKRNPSPPAGWSPMNELNSLGVQLVRLPS